MLGENYAYPKFITSRKDKGISLFKVRTPDKTNGEIIKWKKDLIDIILKYRVKDQSMICRHINYIFVKETLPEIRYISMQHVKC